MHVAHNVFETMGPSSPHFASMRDDMNRTLAWMSMLALPDWGSQHVRTHVELVGDVLEAWEVCKKKAPANPNNRGMSPCFNGNNPCRRGPKFCPWMTLIILRPSPKFQTRLLFCSFWDPRMRSHKLPVH